MDVNNSTSGGGGGGGGGGGAVEPTDGQDSWMNGACDTLRDLTVGPLMTGIVQGFVSVALRRRRERREAAEAAKAAEEKLQEDGAVAGMTWGAPDEK